MTTPINPTNVYPPGYIPPSRPDNMATTGGAPPPPPGPGSYIRRGTGGIYRWGSTTQLQAPPLGPLPSWLSNRQILMASWAGAMVLISFDEWHNYHILPRPARLWDTSIVYGLLMAVSVVDAMVPLANAFGVGYLITLFYQYFGGGGQFPAKQATTTGGGGGRVTAQ